MHIHLKLFLFLLLDFVVCFKLKFTSFKCFDIRFTIIGTDHLTFRGGVCFSSSQIALFPWNKYSFFFSFCLAKISHSKLQDQFTGIYFCMLLVKILFLWRSKMVAPLDLIFHLTYIRYTSKLQINYIGLSFHGGKEKLQPDQNQPLWYDTLLLTSDRTR